MIQDTIERGLKGLQFLTFCLIQPSDESYSETNTPTCCRSVWNWILMLN